MLAYKILVLKPGLSSELLQKLKFITSNFFIQMLHVCVSLNDRQSTPLIIHGLFHCECDAYIIADIWGLPHVNLNLKCRFANFLYKALNS